MAAGPVQPLLSDTAWELLREEDWLPWNKGEVVELRAAGLKRTLVFNPYPEAQAGGAVEIDFRVELYAEEDRLLARLEAPAAADNRDVVYLDDWSNVIQKEGVAAEDKPGCWRLESGLADGTSPYATGGTRLSGAAVELPQLTMPLALKGPYAIFVYSFGGVRLRLSGDLRSDRLGSRVPYSEELWRWTRLDGQHLVVRQSYAFAGPAASSLDYVNWSRSPMSLWRTWMALRDTGSFRRQLLGTLQLRLLGQRAGHVLAPAVPGCLPGSRGLAG